MPKEVHVAERLNMDETLWSIWSDSLTASYLIGHILTVRSVLGHERRLLLFLENRSFLASEQCSWDSAGNFNKKPTGPSRFNRKSLIVIILIDNFYISFFGQTGIWITFVNTKTRERLRNLWLPGLMEGTSQENKSDLWNIEWKSPAWSVCKKCERLFCV